MTSAPLRDDPPMLGKKKPLLRCGPTGKVIQGRYMMGTPLSSTLVPRPVPSRLRESITMFREFSFQSSPVIGHVVSDTSSSVTVPLASTCMLRAAPRTLCWGSSNCAPSNCAPSAGEYSPLLPRTLSTGLENSTAPVSFAWPVFALYSRRSARMTLSPWRMTTLPDNTALPLASKVKSLSSASMVTGVAGSSAAGFGEATAATAGWGQPSSQVWAHDGDWKVSAINSSSVAVEVSLAICALYLYECS